jgi:hypothetical protein
VKKLPNDDKNGPNGRPTNFLMAKILPKSLGDFLLKKNSPKWQNFAPSGHTDLRRKCGHFHRKSHFG